MTFLLLRTLISLNRRTPFSKLVFTMCVLIGLSSTLFQTADVYCQITINEVMFNPAGNENHNEYIELLNTGTAPVDLDGWRIADEDDSDAIIGTGGGTVLNPGIYAIIFDPDYFLNSTIYDSLIPAEALILTIDGSTFGSRGLSNSRPELVSLLTAESDTASSYRYTPDNDDGYSDEKIISGRPNTESNWSNSSTFLGTPGTVNSVTPPEFDLALISVEPVPFVPIAGQTVTYNLMILNNGIQPPQTVSIALFHDSDNNGTINEKEKLFEIPLDTAQIGDFGETTSIAISTSQAPSAGVLSLRMIVNAVPDNVASNDTLSLSLTVLEKENQIVINEIMYQPIGSSPEWIEIVNNGTSEINLKDWRINDRSQRTGVNISPIDAIVPAGGFVVLTRDVRSIKEFYSSTFFAIQVDGFPTLNNDEDEIIISDPVRRVFESVAYHSSWGDNPGVSLERVNPEKAGNERNNWGLSTAPEGATPGVSNTLFASQIPSSVTMILDPNPFSPSRRSEVCTITTSHPLTQALVTMKIFDRYGRLVRNLLRGEPQGSAFSVIWDGKNNGGVLMKTDTYIIYFNAQSTISADSIEYRTTVVLVN